MVGVIVGDNWHTVVLWSAKCGVVADTILCDVCRNVALLLVLQCVCIGVNTTAFGRKLTLF